MSMMLFVCVHQHAKRHTFVAFKINKMQNNCFLFLFWLNMRHFAVVSSFPISFFNMCMYMCVWIFFVHFIHSIFGSVWFSVRFDDKTNMVHKTKTNDFNISNCKTKNIFHIKEQQSKICEIKITTITVQHNSNYSFRFYARLSH